MCICMYGAVYKLGGGGGVGGVVRYLKYEEGFGLPITRGASVDENVTNNAPCEKPEMSWPCLVHKLIATQRKTSGFRIKPPE